MILQLKFEIRPRSLKLCIKFIPIQVSNDTIKQKANYNDHWNSQFQRRTKSLQFDLSLISSYKHVLPKIGKCPHTLKLYRTLWVSRVVLSIITCWKYQDLLNLAYILFAMVVSCTAVRASIRRSRPKSQYEQTRANRRSQNPSSRIRRSREDGKVLWTFAHKSQQSTHVREKRLHRPREPYTQSILRCNICSLVCKQTCLCFFAPNSFFRLPCTVHLYDRACFKFDKISTREAKVGKSCFVQERRLGS